jgi:pimeloyl-ACP methyl ester carboxylesterase
VANGDSLTSTFSSTQPYRERHVPLPGGTLFVGEWGPDDGVPVVAVHGITASHRAWAVVARLLPGHRLLAPDLRGRGGSNGLPAPSGMVRHAADVLAVLDAAGVERAVVAGHSMGGFVALAFAHRHPERVERLVLADGGLPLVLPEGVDVDTAVQVTLGPALARRNVAGHRRQSRRSSIASRSCSSRESSVTCCGRTRLRHPPSDSGTGSRS